jgi:hypothetical protein
MATIKFYLNHPYEKQSKEDKALKAAKVFRKDEVSIDMMFSLNRNERFPLSTKEKIQPKYWDFKEKRAKKTYTGHIELNLSLDKIKTDITELWRNNKDKSLTELKELITVLLRGEAKPKPIVIEEPGQKKTSLFTVGRFIAQCKRERDIKTVNRYRVLWRALGRFLRSERLDFSRLDATFQDKFRNYLYDIPNPLYGGYSLRLDPILKCYVVVPGSDGDPIGLFDETVNKYFVQLKTVCEWVAKRGYQVHPTYKDWTYPSKEYPKITFTYAELKKMESLTFNEKYIIESFTKNSENGKPRSKPTRTVYTIDLNLVQDYVSVEARIGQRISDLKKIGPENFSGNRFSLTQTKGNRVNENTVTFNLKGYCAPALLIFEKYNFRLPQIIEHELNLGIKELARRAGITQDMYIERWAGSKKIRIPGKRYEFFGTHTSKKSCITILGSFGVSTKVISDITGTSQRTIEKHYEGKADLDVVDGYLERVEDNQAVMRKAQ